MRSIKDERRIFDWVGRKLGVKTMDDWYKITRETIRGLGGARLLKKFEGSLPKALITIYPEYEWIPWHFVQIPEDLWQDKATQRYFFDHLGKELHYTQYADWYQISAQMICKSGGRILLSRYGGSPFKALQSVYPEYEWLAWKFSKSPRGFFEEFEHRKLFVEWLAKKLSIKEMDDWYRISLQQIARLAPITQLRTGLDRFLVEMYPTHNWDLSKLTIPNKASQRMLIVVAQQLFPGEEILEDYMHDELRFVSGAKMQLDVFLPHRNLALEYQGEQHYFDIFSLGPSWRYNERDDEKRKACKNKLITLVEVPYWWDFETDSLRATIHDLRPDLLSRGTGIPIPQHPPLGKKKGGLKLNRILIAVGSGAPLTLAQEWNKTQDPTGWWMSEKMDGVRAYWDGEKLLSRQGKEIVVPKLFKERLPSIPLDGELWMGRGTLGKLISTIESDEGNWEDIKYVIFDLPSSLEPFENRIRLMSELVLPRHATVVKNIQCQDIHHLEQYLNEIVEGGGEGVMIREPGSLYMVARTKSLLKMKRFEDSDLIVETVLPATLQCEQSNGIKCNIFFEGEFPPKIGAVITVKHNGYHSDGTLKHPSFWRERKDVHWGSESPGLLLDRTWVSSHNRKIFFDLLGEELGFRNMEDWYQLKLEDVRKFGGSGMLQQFFGNCLSAALRSVYPQYEWIPWKLSQPVPAGFWDKTENHKWFFDWLFKEIGLKTTEEWYTVTVEEICSYGGSRLIFKYKNSPSKALMSIYPQHPWMTSKFLTRTKRVGYLTLE